MIKYSKKECTLGRDLCLVLIKTSHTQTSKYLFKLIFR